MTEVGMPMDKEASNVSSGNNKTQQVVKNVTDILLELIILNELQHEGSTCVVRKDSDQPSHQHSLISIFLTS